MEVVAPLMQMASTSMIAISTIRGSDNFYSKMLQCVHPVTKLPLFETHWFTLICDACKASDEPWKCVHRLNEIPRWQSSDKHEMLKTLLGDHTDLLQRESMGLCVDDIHRAFTSKSLDAFDARPRTLVCPATVIFTSIDPSGGGPSHYAVVSTKVVNGITTVSNYSPLLARRYASMQRRIPRPFSKTIPNSACRISSLFCTRSVSLGSVTLSIRVERNKMMPRKNSVLSIFFTDSIKRLPMSYQGHPSGQMSNTAASIVSTMPTN